MNDEVNDQSKNNKAVSVTDNGVVEDINNDMNQDINNGYATNVADNKGNKENKKDHKPENEQGTQQPQATDLSLTIEKLEGELREAKAKAEENWNLLLRAKAEIENVRRRAILDLEKAHKYSIDNLARELIHVVDSLDKGLEASTSGNAEQLEALLHGMQLTHKLLVDTLDKFGIKELNPIGEAFDPSKHEALTMQESDAVLPNSILMVVQKGYSIHERILRPARVIVAKSSSTTELNGDAAGGAGPKIDEKA